jgi:hypothetical protein
MAQARPVSLEGGVMECLNEMGYINDECRHVLIGIEKPALLNVYEHSVQIAITIETAQELQVRLGDFLNRHRVTVQ